MTTPNLELTLAVIFYSVDNSPSKTDPSLDVIKFYDFLAVVPSPIASIITSVLGIGSPLLPSTYR